MVLKSKASTIQQAQRLYVQWSHDIEFDYSGGRVPNGTEAEFDWEDYYNPSDHYIGSKLVGPTVWRRERVGENGTWTFPQKISGFVIPVEEEGTTVESIWVEDDGTIKYKLSTGQIVIAGKVSTGETAGSGIVSVSFDNGTFILTIKTDDGNITADITHEHSPSELVINHNNILTGNSDNEGIVIPITEDTIIGRLAGEDVKGLTVQEVRNLLKNLGTKEVDETGIADESMLIFNQTSGKWEMFSKSDLAAKTFVTVGDSTINSRGIDGEYADIASAKSDGKYNILMVSDCNLGGAITGLDNATDKYDLNIKSINKDFKLIINSGEEISRNDSVTSWSFENINFENFTIIVNSTSDCFDYTSNNLNFKDVVFDLNLLTVSSNLFINGNNGAGNVNVTNYEIKFATSGVQYFVRCGASGNYINLRNGIISQGNTNSYISIDGGFNPGRWLSWGEIDGLRIDIDINKIELYSNFNNSIKNVFGSGVFNIELRERASQIDNCENINLIHYKGGASSINYSTFINSKCITFQIQSLTSNYFIKNLNVENIICDNFIFSIAGGRVNNTYENINISKLIIRTSATFTANSSDVIRNVNFQETLFASVSSINNNNLRFNQCQFESSFTLSSNFVNIQQSNIDGVLTITGDKNKITNNYIGTEGGSTNTIIDQGTKNNTSHNMCELDIDLSSAVTPISIGNDTY